MPSRVDDLSKDGRLLITADFNRAGVVAGTRDGSKAWELHQALEVILECLSPDGSRLVYIENGETRKTGYRMFLYDLASSSSSHLGYCLQTFPCFSPDGSRVVSIVRDASLHPVLNPTGTGIPRELASHGISEYFHLEWAPGGKLLICGREGGREPRIYLQDPEGGLEPLLPEGYVLRGRTQSLSPDGTRLVAGFQGRQGIIRLDGTARAKDIQGLAAEDRIIGWWQDSRHLLVHGKPFVFPVQVYLLDPDTGRRKPFVKLAPMSCLGRTLATLTMTPDGRTWAVQWVIPQQDLYVIDGLR